MPLLDAAIAFALTMLALSSLVSVLQEWLQQWQGIRHRMLLQMLETYRRDYVIPLAEKRMSGGDAERTSAPKESWGRLFGLDELKQTVRSKGLTHVDDDLLTEKIRGSEAVGRLAQSSRLDPKSAFEELQAGWQELSKDFTELFRRRAKRSATLIALALAFGFNIDALHVLGTYMQSEAAREAALSRGAPWLEAAPDASPDEPPAERAGASEALAYLRAPLVPLGWGFFPNCPPTSTDGRCLRYWQRAESSFDLSGLSFEERRQINPLRSPRRALGMFSDDTRPSRNTPVPTLEHTSTDGGPATDGGHAGSEIDPSLLGALPIWSLVGWIFGCLLTGFLAGLGSTFWIEVVRRLAVARDELRRQRTQAENDAQPPDPKRKPASHA